ncbi:adhesin [Streptomyces sp. GMY02]|uniref:adhesin n=1 Tax=Streptomyces sp. GMY02 TaxID=1333528 RepID=UPI0020B6B2F3|nr:adhesin [Streptomyces sp. GMY02]
MVVLTLCCVGATVAAVAGSGGGDPVEDTGPRAAPTGFGPPQLPGLAGAADPGESADPAGTPPDSDADSGADSAGGFTAWAGPGCTTGAYEEHGRFENGDAAWYTVPSGGHRDAACDGSFTAVPMSGSPDHDRGSTAIWSWKLGKEYARCALAVYVPDSGHAPDSAGHPTVYRVLTAASRTTSPAASHTPEPTFGIRQTTHRGTLVDVGSYRVDGDSFSVQLLDRGQDWGTPDRYSAHHAAAQMKLACA